jgi:hypothetical protein
MYRVTGNLFKAVRDGEAQSLETVCRDVFWNLWQVSNYPGLSAQLQNPHNQGVQIAVLAS